MNSWEQFVCFHSRGLYRGAMVAVVRTSCSRVRCQSVRENCGAGLNMFQKKGSQSIGLGVGDDLEATTAESLGELLLHGHCNEDLASGPSPPLPRPDASNHGFVHFNVAGKSVVCSVSNGTTEAMKHRPGRLVGTKTQKAMKRFGRHSILRCGHMPSSSEPYSEGRLCVVEDSARCSGNPALACFTPPASITHAPALFT